MSEEIVSRSGIGGGLDELGRSVRCGGLGKYPGNKSIPSFGVLCLCGQYGKERLLLGVSSSSSTCDDCGV